MWDFPSLASYWSWHELLLFLALDDEATLWTMASVEGTWRAKGSTQPAPQVVSAMLQLFSTSQSCIWC